MNDVARTFIQSGAAQVQNDQCGSPLGGLLHAQPPDRHLFVQVAGHHHDGIPLPQILQVAALANANFGDHIATSQPPVGQINIVAAQPFAEKLLEKEHIFVTDAISADASNGRSILLQLSGDGIQRFVPFHFNQLAILAQQRLPQTVRRIRKVMHKPISIRNPNLVYLLILPRHDSLNYGTAARFCFTARAKRHVCARRTVRRQRGHRGQLPRPCAKAEISGCQCPYRANIRRVAAPVRIEARVRHRYNFQAAASIVETNDRIIRNFFLEAHATAALNAPFPIQIN